MPKPPMFFAAFANDNNNWLNELANEEISIRNILRNRHDSGRIEFVSIGQANIDDIYRQFNFYNSRIEIFHFGGHSNSDLIQLRGGSQRASNLAKLMGINNRLHLVVLNGCSNREQVKWLLESGVKVVVATSAGIYDKWASIFAEKFYSCLDAGNSILDSFNRTIIYLEQLPINPFDKNIIVTRDMIFDVNNSNSKLNFPWGIFTLDESDPTLLNWKLSNNQILEANINLNEDYQTEVPIASFKNDLNKTFVITALKGISENKNEIRDSLDKFNRDQSPDLLIDLENMLVDFFPFSVSLHIRDLFTDELMQSGRRRLKKIKDTYSAVSKLLALITISNVWANCSSQNFKIHPTYLNDIQEFICLSEGKAEYFDYTWLLFTAYHILKENNIKPFIKEMESISNMFDSNLYESYKYLEDLKIRIINDSIHQNEVIELCLEAEKYLGHIVNAASFLVEYEFVSVRNISVKNKYRELETNFVHEGVVKLRGGALNHSIDIVRKNFTEDRSILVTKGFYGNSGKSETHNLLPFFFDLNSFSRLQHPMPMMCQYHHRNASELVYQIIDQNNKFVHIKSEMSSVQYEDLDILINLFNKFEKEINI